MTSALGANVLHYLSSYQNITAGIVTSQLHCFGASFHRFGARLIKKPIHTTTGFWCDIVQRNCDFYVNVITWRI